MKEKESDRPNTALVAAIAFFTVLIILIVTVTINISNEHSKETKELRESYEFELELKDEEIQHLRDWELEDEYVRGYDDGYEDGYYWGYDDAENGEEYDDSQ